MAKFALVHKMETRVHEVVDNVDQCFDVHEDLSWFPCPDETTRMWDYNWETKEFFERPQPMTNYMVARKVGYGEVGEQLDAIYKGYQNGDADPLSTWADKINNVKILIPKGDENQLAVHAMQMELNRRTEQMIRDFEDGKIPAILPPSVMTQELAEDYKAGRWVNPVSGPYVP